LSPACRFGRAPAAIVVVTGLLWPGGASAEPATLGHSGPDWAAIEREEKVLRLGIAGGMMFAQTYTTTAFVATGELLLCWYEREHRLCGLDSVQRAWYELYIPLAGPFVALRHEQVRSNWKYTAAFGASGAFQTVGVTLAALSLLWPKAEASRSALPVTWLVSRDAQALAYRGTF